MQQGRGQDYLFTPTGEAMTLIAAGMFTSWLTGITERRRRLGATVTVATTEFTVDFLAQVWPSVTAEFTRREIELNIVHVRTRDPPGPSWTPRTATWSAAASPPLPDLTPPSAPTTSSNGTGRTWP